MTEHDTQALQEMSRVLWGAKAWRVNLNLGHRFEKGYSQDGYLDALTFEFKNFPGDSEVPRMSSKFGSLWINAEACHVRLEQNGEILVYPLEASTKALAQFPLLVAKHLIRVEITPPAGDTTFIFDDDLLICCYPVISVEEDCWRITTSNTGCLTLGPGARWSYRSDLR